MKSRLAEEIRAASDGKLYNEDRLLTEKRTDVWETWSSEICIPSTQVRSGMVVFYEIRVIVTSDLSRVSKTDTVFHRFDDFFLLYAELSKSFPDIILPELPPKILFANWQTDVVNQRRSHLEAFLRACFRKPQLAHDPALVRFLPSVYAHHIMHAKRILRPILAHPASPLALKAECASFSPASLTESLQYLTTASIDVNQAQQVHPNSSLQQRTIRFSAREVGIFGVRNHVQILLDLGELNSWTSISLLFQYDASSSVKYSLISLVDLDPLVHSRCQLFLLSSSNAKVDMRLEFASADELTRFYYALLNMCPVPASASASDFGPRFSLPAPPTSSLDHHRIPTPVTTNVTTATTATTATATLPVTSAPLSVAPLSSHQPAARSRSRARAVFMPSSPPDVKWIAASLPASLPAAAAQSLSPDVCQPSSRSTLGCASDSVSRRGFELDSSDAECANEFVSSEVEGKPSENWVPLPVSKPSLEPCSFKILTTTWNLARHSPADSFDGWLPPAGGSFDMIAIGVQECSYGNLLVCESDFASRLLSHLTPAQSRDQTNGSDFVLIAAQSLWEIRLFLFVRRHYVPDCHQIETTTMATGLWNVFGNKGAVVIALRLATRSLCFVTSHLAPHQATCFWNKRDQMYRELASKLRIGHPALEIVNQFDAFFWFGDFNYRFESAPARVYECIARQGWGSLYLTDQLRRSHRVGRAFPVGLLTEPPIEFPPTYKLGAPTSRGSQSQGSQSQGQGQGSLLGLLEPLTLSTASHASTLAASRLHRASRFSSKHGLWLYSDGTGVLDLQQVDDDLEDEVAAAASVEAVVVSAGKLDCEQPGDVAASNDPKVSTLSPSVVEIVDSSHFPEDRSDVPELVSDVPSISTPSDFSQPVALAQPPPQIQQSPSFSATLAPNQNLVREARKSIRKFAPGPASLETLRFRCYQQTGGAPHNVANLTKFYNSVAAAEAAEATWSRRARSQRNSLLQQQVVVAADGSPVLEKPEAAEAHLETESKVATALCAVRDAVIEAREASEYSFLPARVIASIDVNSGNGAHALVSARSSISGSGGSSSAGGCKRNSRVSFAEVSSLERSASVVAASVPFRLPSALVTDQLSEGSSTSAEGILMSSAAERKELIACVEELLTAIENSSLDFDLSRARSLLAAVSRQSSSSSQPAPQSAPQPPASPGPDFSALSGRHRSCGLPDFHLPPLSPLRQRRRRSQSHSTLSILPRATSVSSASSASPSPRTASRQPSFSDPGAASTGTSTGTGAGIVDLGGRRRLVSIAAGGRVNIVVGAAAVGTSSNVVRLPQQRAVQRAIHALVGRQYEASRVPAWCDRVFYSSAHATSLSVDEYAAGLQLHPTAARSDHLPVWAAFTYRLPPPPPAAAWAGSAEVFFSDLHVRQLCLQPPVEFNEAATVTAVPENLKVYLTFYNRAFLTSSCEALRTWSQIFGKITKIDQQSRVCVSWQDMDLPVLSSVMGIRSSIAHEKIFVVVRCGTSDSEPQLGQALVSLQSILEHDEWSLNVPLSKFGVVVGRLVGRIVVSCLE